MSFLRNVLVLSLVTQVVLGQSSSSDQMFSIQTDPATPTSSASSASSASASSSPSGQLGSGMGTFPEQCNDDCTPVAQSLTNCGIGDLTGFNVTCLCNSQVESSLLTCVDCALAAESNPGQATSSYQSLVDAYIEQCAYASVTLSSATVGLYSSTSGAPSSSGSSRSSSPGSVTGSAASGSASTSSLAATSSAASAASSAAASSTPSNTAARGMDRAWTWSLAGVGGVVVAAAVGL